MSFLEALTTSYFWAYTLTAAALLGAGWAALFPLQRRGAKTDELRRHFWSGALLAGTTVGAVLLGKEGFALVVALLSVFACREFARATGLYADWLFTALVYLGILLVNGVALWAGGTAYRDYGYELFMATPIYAVAVLCALPVLRNQSEGMLQRVALSVMAFVYFGYFLAHLSLLAGFFQGPEVGGEVVGYVFFVVFGCGVTGLAADLGDRWLGRRPIAPGITAERTWEGAAVTLAAAFCWCFALGWTLPHFTWLTVLLCFLLLGVVGTLSDLVMRYAMHGLRLNGPTVSGHVDPVAALEHLDRLVFVAPLFFRIVHVFGAW